MKSASAMTRDRHAKAEPERRFEYGKKHQRVIRGVSPEGQRGKHQRQYRVEAERPVSEEPACAFGNCCVPRAKPDEISRLDYKTRGQNDDDGFGWTAADEPRDRLQGKQRANQQEIEGGKDEFLPAKGIVIFDCEVAGADRTRQRAKRPEIPARFMVRHSVQGSRIAAWPA